MPQLSPNRLPGKASVVTLDYSFPEQSRKEHSILYFNPNWDELVDFLTDPLGMLKEYEKLFPDPLVAWELNAPVTARIEPVSTFGFGPSAKMVNPGRLSSTQRFMNMARTDGIVGQVSFEEALQTPELLNGAFLLEFAPHTRSLMIAYLPPASKFPEIAEARNQPNAAAAQGYYDTPTPDYPGGRLTQSILCFVEQTQTATVHFDIGQLPRMRAGFIVDHLENPARTCQRLNAQFGLGGKIANATMAAEGTPGMSSLEPEVELPKTFNIRAGDVRKRLPTMFVEDIDNTGTPYVCGIVPVVTDDPDDPNHLFLGDVVLKDYPPPPVGDGGGN